MLEWGWLLILDQVVSVEHIQAYTLIRVLSESCSVNHISIIIHVADAVQSKAR